MIFEHRAVFNDKTLLKHNEGPAVSKHGLSDWVRGLKMLNDHNHVLLGFVVTLWFSGFHGYCSCLLKNTILRSFEKGNSQRKA